VAGDGAPFEVVIAGGGVAALEASMALRELAGDRVGLTLLAPTDEFTYRPVAVMEPFAHRPPRQLSLARVAADLNAALERDSLASVDPQRTVAHTASGRDLPYDALLIAVGARTTEAVPGAIALNPASIGASLQSVIDGIDRGAVRSLALVAPRPTWPPPVYELALLTREDAADLEIEIITAESRPMRIFGDEISAAVEDLLNGADIKLTTSAHVISVNDVLTVEPGMRRLEVDRTVAMPRLAGPAITGLPSEPYGFLPISPHCEVVGAQRVFAAGDATSFPLKFGGIAAKQADAAAASIAALAGVDVEPTRVDGTVHGALIAGRGNKRLYFTATFVGGHARDSRISDEPTWSPEAKVAAQHLGPYLDEQWASGVRWVAGQLSWETILRRLERRFGEPAEPSSVARPS
jgi:sulfide:quinone oxidoreductase